MAAITARESLLLAYRETDYAAWDAAGRAVGRIDRSNPEIDALLARLVAATGVFVTAWNPRSEPSPEAANTEAATALADAVAVAGWRALPARAEPWNPAWAPEEGLLVLDLDRDTALALAERFGQNAIVLFAPGRPAELATTGLMDDSATRTG
jgi:hypothetical protein